MPPRRAKRDAPVGDDDDLDAPVGPEAGAPPAPPPPGFLGQAMRSVVRVFCTHVKPNFAQPWSMKPPQKSTSSGFVIAGRIIVTNAHSVSNASLIQVRKQGAFFG